MFRILVVEDDNDLRHQLVDFLSGLKVEVEDADCPDNAYRKLLDKPFNFIVSDFNMPGGTGKDILQYMKEKGIDTPTIIFSGGKYDPSVNDFSNCLGIIDKPDMEKLKSIIESFQQGAVAA